MLRFRSIALAATLSCAGCPAAGDQTRPPDDQFFFPAGLAVSDDERFLFVANANGELRYDSGTIAVVDVDRVAEMVAEWLATGSPLADTDDCDDCCEVDGSYSYTMVCNERRAIRAEATARLGSFASQIALQTLASGALRLFVPVRSDPSITWLDFVADPPGLSCGGNGSSPCDSDHRLTRLRDDPDLSVIASDPYGIYVDSGNGYAVVTHIATATVSLLDTPPDGSPPQLVDSLGGMFSYNSSGYIGAFGVAGRQPGNPDDLVYVTSLTESRVQTLYVHRPEDPAEGDFPELVASYYFFLDQVSPSDDSRDIVFSDDGNRAYVVNRDPPMLLFVDTTMGDDGLPANQFLGSVEICPQASMVTLADLGRGDRAYVTCFRDSQVWVIDLDRMELESIIPVGRGPTEIAVAPEHRLLFVADYLDDTLSVIDLNPGSMTENHTVLRLGRARQSGGE